MNEDERSLLEKIIRERELNRFLMMASRLLFFDVKSMLHIYERDAGASFLAGRKLYERMGITLKEDQMPFVVPSFIYGFDQENDGVIIKPVSIQIYDISQTSGKIPEEKVDIEDALKQREKALIIGDGTGSGYCERTDIGLLFHVPGSVQKEQKKLWESLLVLYTEECFLEKGCPEDILVPFVKCILRMHFLKTEGRDVGILNVKLANSDISSAFEILSDAFWVSRVLVERITYRRLSFNQTLIVNGVLQPEKEQTLIYLELLKESIQDPFLKWEVDDLKAKLMAKSDDFIRALYREKITGNGIYTYPYKNMEDQELV